VRGCRTPLTRALPLLLAVALPSSVVSAQDFSCERGDREVRSVRFDGNREFADLELAAAIATLPSSRAGLPVFGTRRCLDPTEFARDVQRLEVLYRRRGYPEVRVDTLMDTLRTGVIDITFAVREGTPMRVSSLSLRGLDAVPDADDIAERFPLRAGALFDRAALEAGRDSLVRRLRNSGWAGAEALLAYTTDERAHIAEVEVVAVPGTRARIGTVRIIVDSSESRPRVAESTIRRAMAVSTGDWYSARALIAAQRSLYQLDAFRRVDLQLDREPTPGDSVVDLTVRVLEGDRFAAQGGVGWATLDCLRMQGAYTDRDFMPWAPRLELNGRVSKVGIGAPLDGAEGICQQQARQDPYSRTLNYYAGVTLRQPSTGRRSRVPTVSLYSSTLSEFRAFLRRTPIGGALSVTNPLQARVPSTLSYQVELGRTEAEPAFFCAVFNTCDQESRAFLQRNTRLAAIGYTASYDGTDNPLRPSRGWTVRLDARHASTLLGSDASQQFSRLITDATWHTSLGGGATLLAHVRGGVVFGGGTTPTFGGFIPPQERLYAGGPTTVRGFRQNELGPAVYIVPGFNAVAEDGAVFYRADTTAFEERVVPVGGNSLVVGNLELQVPSPVLRGLLSWAAFADAGRLWNRGAVTGVQQQLENAPGFKVTPGVGVRVVSPFGSIRIDLGYNGYRLPAGAAYFNAPLQAGVAPLYCVSPGNTLPVTTALELGAPPVQASGPCPTTYRPPARPGFFRRLNPSIWIGQAF
jgi:outer membrane protein insertion porin family/translocation and assembly module TamA